MPISLYDITVPAFQQQLGAVAVLLDKAEAHCAERGVAERDIVDARLHADMFPFSYHVKSTFVHSVGALQSLPKGVFSPDFTPPPETFAALKQKVAEGLSALDAVKPAEVNAYEGADMRFEFKAFKMPFRAENFLMSFSLPNFYFHATTAYDILRHKGVGVGKLDFMGQLRVKS